jgi:hypothetical protein
VPLPASVRAYVDRAVGDGPTPRRIRIAQRGQMWLKPRGRAMRFVAEETFEVAEVAFRWRARFRPLPLEIVDSYERGRGALVGRLFGRIPVLRQDAPELAEGEAARYLAELPWVPYAIAENAELEWQELDRHTVEVSTHGDGTRASVRFEFDADGDFAAAASADRPRLQGKEIVRAPWRGRFWDYGVLSGIRVPTRGEVAWELPEGSHTYWRARMTELELER